MELEIAKKIIKKLQDNGHEAVLAGGCVRDFLLNTPPKDYDIATSALPTQVEKIFDNNVSIGKAFGVINVIEDGMSFEIATYRTDGLYLDGRRPDNVEFTNMEEDAKRRDLTINGMFLNPFHNQVCDFVGGQDDLKNKIVRFIGDPWERIAEDKLRMLRAIRFAIKLDFTMEPETFKAIKQNSFFIQDVSKERIKEEFYKILELKKSKLMWKYLYETDIIYYILPELLMLHELPQNIQHHPEEKDTLQHSLHVYQNLCDDSGIEDTDLLFAGLLHDIGKRHTFTQDDEIHNYGHEEIGAEIVIRICERRFRMSNESTEKIIYLVRNHMRIGRAHLMKKSKLKKMMSDEHYDLLLALHKADRKHEPPEYFEFFDQKKKEFESSPITSINPEPLINGNDLIALGLVPGIRFSEILEKVKDKQLEEVITDKKAAINFVKEWICRD